MKKEITTSSLSRFKIADEHLVTEELVKAEISRAFNEKRCFEFYPDKDLIHKLKNGEPEDNFHDKFIDIRNK